MVEAVLDPQYLVRDIRTLLNAETQYGLAPDWMKPLIKERWIQISRAELAHFTDYKLGAELHARSPVETQPEVMKRWEELSREAYTLPPSDERNPSYTKISRWFRHSAPAVQLEIIMMMRDIELQHDARGDALPDEDDDEDDEGDLPE
jgi:hypothetical protein